MPQKMSSEDMENTVGRMIDEAEDFIEQELSGIREQATAYYHGDPFGNEEDGRSQVVSTTLRDTVLGIMPSLMRMFFGANRVVQFKPRGPEDVAGAEQKTDYVNYIVKEDNPGFMIHYSAFMDSLIRKLGFVKWWWETKTEITETHYTGLLDSDMEQLLLDDELELEITERVEEVTPEGVPFMTYSLTATRTVKDGRIKLAAVPGEEILWNRNARTLEDAIIVVHSRTVMMADIIALGFDETLEDLQEMAGTLDTNSPRTDETAARRFDKVVEDEDNTDPATMPIRYDEAYALLDRDGKGQVMRYKLCMVGDNHKLLHRNKKPAVEGVDHLNIAMFPCIPEPHTVIGQDYYDLTKDLQKIDSSILRGTLDSMALALTPRTEIVDGQVNLKDLLNPEIGSVVRVENPNMMREIAHRFVGADSLLMLEYTNSIRENRTKQTRAAEGLDADALQSSTKTAVAATLNAAQAQLEFLARIYAETGIKEMYKGILKTLIQHQDQPRTVRLRNEWVEMDPKTWDATMDVSVNVALGAGTNDDKIKVLQAIAAEQEKVMSVMGPDNPLTSPARYRNTMARMTELAGELDPDQFWAPLTVAEEEAAKQQAAQQPPQPSPDTLALVEVETAKIQQQVQKDQADMQLKQQELALKAKAIDLEDDRERDKAAAELAVKIKELELKHATSIQRSEISADSARLRSEMASETAIATELLRQGGKKNGE